MQKTILLLLTLVLLVTLGLFYMDKNQKDIPKKYISSTMPYDSQKLLDKRLPPNNKKTTYSPKTEVVTKIQKDQTPTHISLYEPISIQEASLFTKPRDTIIPVAAIRIQQILTSNKVGKHLIFPDIQGNDYTLTINSVNTNSDGSISLTASYKDEGITYISTITQSDTSSYINLSTPNGLYEIETKGKIGYIYKTNDIRKQLQNHKKSDVIILPIPN